MNPLQHPIPSGFDGTSTASDVLGDRDLTGTVALVTGGYAGLGLEVTRTLAGAGATVVVPARTPDKARAALAGEDGVELEALDLADPASIEALVGRFLASGRALDILVNNAGIMAAPQTRDARGYESHFATNHLGHFALTAGLWPALTRAAGARVVSLTSLAHRFSPVDFDDVNFERRDYEKWSAYGQSMSAKSLFAVALDERAKERGVRAFAVHPGRIDTEITRFLSSTVWAASTPRTPTSPG